MVPGLKKKIFNCNKLLCLEMTLLLSHTVEPFVVLHKAAPHLLIFFVVVVPEAIWSPNYVILHR